MRELTSHNVNELNGALNIFVLDEPGTGGANHLYKVTSKTDALCAIKFQNGPMPTNGVNGLTQECLLAIVEDRLKCFQAGKFACRENAIALTKIQEALHWLHSRTRERTARGVEGTLEK